MDSATGTVTEHFEGSDLADDRWVPHYLPHWSSREGTRASYDVHDSVLRLRVPVGQGLWCPDRHRPSLRTSTVASGLYAGPLGSTLGQQPFADGLTVTEEQPPFRGWLVSGGRVTVRARADLTARSMVSVWMTGFEDEPDRCGEVCVFEVFGDTVTSSSAGVGAGVHAFRDPALGEDFSVTPVDLDLREWHDYSVSMTPSGCTWTVDGRALRTSAECPSYPLQLFVGVFDFPEREDGTTRDHEPSLEVDWIRHEPL
ncbi:glycosyl hydrolase family protein [Nocardioides oleivorans]|uniref:Glycosyl hydrolase family protein n=1 Tax=Nocardioides oleivorans TaxID=273676 RepID=A0A4Q2RY60_9ACTN|nr:glycoside hydrolase family 16 protein [Nocardioides oleivorans]RYB94008.1 glycosyl hydrolase family protein [Nocardioides oleivorans]